MSDHGSNGLAAPGTVAYSEPHFPALATLIAVLYLAQVARNIAGKLLYAGLLGEIAIGVIFGPVAKLLPVRAKPNPQGPGITAIDGRATDPSALRLQNNWETTFLVVGYIGLVLIMCVFEERRTEAGPPRRLTHLLYHSFEGGLTTEPSTVGRSKRHRVGVRS